MKKFFLIFLLLLLLSVVFTLADVYAPPYDMNFSWGKEIGSSHTKYKANEKTGYVGIYADSFVGGSTAEAIVYKNIYIPYNARVNIKAKVIYMGGTVAFGFASFAGIEKIWTIDNNYYREDLDSPFGYDDIRDKIISLATLASPLAEGKEIAEVIEILGLLNDLNNLKNAFSQYLSAGKAREIDVNFSFNATPGNHRIGIGVRGNTGAVLTGSAFSIIAALVDSMEVNIESTVTPQPTPTSETILNVPGLGVVRPGSDGRSVFIQSYGPYVEYELQFGNSYQQGEVKPGEIINVSIPHYRTFELTIARPIEGKMGWASIRENDGRFVYKTQTTSGSAVFNTNATVLNVSGLGVVKMGQPGYLVIQSTSGNYIEFSLHYGSTYIQGEVKPGESISVAIPHYVTFNLTIARPVAGRIGWLCGRENDGKLVYVSQVSSNSAAFGSNKVLLNVSGLGKVAVGTPSTVILQSTSGEVIEYSLAYGNEYYQGEVSPNSSVNINIPHYMTFDIVIARPCKGKIGWLHGRENDGIIVYVAK